MSPSIRKLTGRIGAVVEGVDFTAPPDLSTITTLRHALNEHKAIVFDNVSLDNAGQERVAGWFGELTTAHPNVPARPHCLARLPGLCAVPVGGGAGGGGWVIWPRWMMRGWWVVLSVGPEPIRSWVGSRRGYIHSWGRCTRARTCRKASGSGLLWRAV
ncbi:TauD/TfdA family dioxygenase [Streptomyces sp. CA-135486]|uniref:TauD/TfdA family dioxygenase n=1 Tax=Streptomyces sp. CA-135486 TaxID=3240049 RepID=UPI003D8FA4EB